MQEIKTIKVAIPLFDYVESYGIDKDIVIYGDKGNDSFNMVEILSNTQILLKERQSATYILVNRSTDTSRVFMNMVRIRDIPTPNIIEQELPFKKDK